VFLPGGIHHFKGVCWLKNQFLLLQSHLKCAPLAYDGQTWN